VCTVACIQDFEQDLRTNANVRAGQTGVFVEPLGGQYDFENGYTGGIHRLYIKSFGFKHNVDVFGKHLDVLENETEDFGFLDVFDYDVHIVCCG
jgi:hypothetical protein